MAVLLPVLGLFASVAVAAVVYADATRRDLHSRVRTASTFGVGLGSLACFLGVWLSEGAVVGLYLDLVRSPPVVVAPREVLAVRLAAGLVFAVAAAIVYRAGTHGGPANA